MNKKSTLFTMHVSSEASAALKALEKAGVAVFVEVIDDNAERRHKHPDYDTPMAPSLTFYSLDPAGL